MRIGIPKEIQAGEKRVAATPDTVGKMVKAGLSVTIQSGAGIQASCPDDQYAAAGAAIESDPQLIYNASNVLLKVNRPLFHDALGVHELDLMQTGATLIAPLFLAQYPDLLNKIRLKKITAFALELVPRIARAQSMDILSSMSNIAGYKSIILAADHLGKLFPMMTTAAGTIAPAKVIVIGAGVAGLQAIATARRLGGVVIAFDTRPPVAEQVKSLGADFVTLAHSSAPTEAASGYATEQSSAFYQHEQATIAPYLKEADVVVTTALIPGKRAPLLITEAMVKTMKPGSVLVDLAAEQGGNCEIIEPGKITQKEGITLIGTLNLPSALPVHASQLYAKNVFSFLNYIMPQLAQNALDQSDDIIKSCLVAHRGEIVHPTIQPMMSEGG